MMIVKGKKPEPRGSSLKSIRTDAKELKVQEMLIRANVVKMAAVKTNETMTPMMILWTLMTSQAMLKEVGKSKETEIKAARTSVTNLNLKAWTMFQMRIMTRTIDTKVSMQLSREITVS
jgi:hypothetical protein